MCLSAVTKKTIIPKNNPVIGYKVIKLVNDGKYYPLYYHANSPPQFKFSEWMKDKQSVEVCNIEGECYNSGFHFFLNLSDALKVADCDNRRKVVRAQGFGQATYGRQFVGDEAVGVICVRNIFLEID